MKAIVCGALAAVFVLPPSAFACGPHFFYRPPVVVEKVVEVPVVATTFVPVVVGVPTYGVGYPPPPVPAAPQAIPGAAPAAVAPPSQCEQKSAALEARLAELERKLAWATQQPAPPAAAPPGQAANGKTALAIFQGKCASCHGATVFSDKGNGFKLLEANGTLAQLTDRQFRKIGTYTYTQRMPKGGPPLSDEEVATIQGWLDAQK